ncbi:MAG: hypothetical protein A3D24_03170 [Candidatus Blackburnbacteria bacterium RIFCSPHIGHO2_02_FULL_39_13]|uniref:Antitoxin n=1 Tax=Candidatus Blackburnbacteria bacterium RIFCSPLOWO2_01_FULL_40_20 TaxID=1797519 RepID=A0A1G1VFK1_9BACT|nr:MAG: hypothetical protein A2694_04470 [Candidatus Blackburnbacteria bacterium RIFCSPHIGHO2_01_FULL_40_17]OGY08832.1 MAG: hypothetical protein A3D24_03170 [Candidatus Blackburnbacteria bacterium RIFCSPHIGHO2_02_FULL_39_13]OGY14205.1 MAG: hypothetical protein A3A77_01855 [Candidatus Blackburnbacteria bacterium RIFCSPLOWO2_01_FULL_40_20]HBL51998.1 hypothetical protein [Candidatus Blackburnbacteria bacterium]
MRSVNSFNLRNNLSEYLDTVAKTEASFVVNRFGKSVAILSPYKESGFKIEEYFGFLGKGESGKKFIDRLRRNSKERDRIKKLRGK